MLTPPVTSITSDQNKGIHYDLIKKAIPPWLAQTSIRRARELNATPLKIPQWHNPLSASEQQLLKLEVGRHWSAQNTVDRILNEAQDVYAFAEPLLQKALKERFGLQLDVRETWLQLYAPAETPWWVHNFKTGVQSRTVSLLDAALHNFASDEHFTADSDFISRPDARGHFQILPVRQKISVEQFKALCRDLDIGAQYQRHLHSILLPTDGVARTMLQRKITEGLKAALSAAAQLALAKKDISLQAHEVVLGMLEDRKNLQWNGQSVGCYNLTMMDTALTGVLVICADPADRQPAVPLITYVPHDPEHPLKEYPSSQAFMTELTRQLRVAPTSTSPGYQAFFSQFVAHQQRGHFFAGLNERLSTVKWQPAPPGSNLPSWRDTPVNHPYLQFSLSAIEADRQTRFSGDLWEYFYQQKLNKVLKDAREIAVSTEYTDRMARWAWWDNLEKMLSDVFNAALLVVAPFVPGLGELMLAYTAYQLTEDVIEGVVDLAEGQWEEGAEHVVGVVYDTVQLLGFAAGAKIAGEFQLKTSAFVESLKPVELANGETRLWFPDISPYAHDDLTLPAFSKPDTLGLHHHEGKLVLPLEDQHYVVQQTSGEHRLQHPARPEAYAPKLSHNSQGAWTHEGEDPRNWENSTLMTRLGYSTHGFSLQQLENVRLISGVEEDSLRRMHVENAAPPLLLEDALKRVRAFVDVDTAGTHIRSGQPMEADAYWFEQMVTELPGWPAECALKVYENADLSGTARTYGNADASPQNTLSMSLGDVMAGRLPPAVTAFLDEARLEVLLGGTWAKEQQVQALRNRLADQVDASKAVISKRLYDKRETSQDPRILRLQSRYPALPTVIAEKLLNSTPQSELNILDNGQHIPSDLNGRARESAFESRSNGAYEGFFQDELLTADSERLALNVLRLHSDTFSNLRIEIREHSRNGSLRCSVGPDDATEVRWLVRDSRGRYEAYLSAENKLPGNGDLYDAILHVIPDGSLRELELARGQGAALRQWLRDQARLPSERRTLLLEPSIRPVAQRQTELLLRGPGLSKRPQSLEQRVKDLYPDMTDREVDTFILSLPAAVDRVHVLRTLGSDLIELSNTLDAWKLQMSPIVAEEHNITPPEVRRIAEKLLECFRRKPRIFDERSTTYDGGYALDLSSEFGSHDIERWWKRLPDIKKYLDQITTLSLDNTSFSQRSGGLLQDFIHLRRLSARRCQLTRLPEGVGRMRLLETLRLSDNNIQLTPHAVEQLRGLTRLQSLRLDHNPQLGRVPDIGRMPRLKVLNLAHTGIDSWPEGLMNKHRPKGFFLDLQGNPIKIIPNAAPRSDEAWILSRARLNVGELRSADREALFTYRQSMGLPAQNTYAPLANNARAKWPLDYDSPLWGRRSPGLGTYRVEAWDNLMSEPNSEGFFRVIDQLTTSADYRAAGPSRALLSRRVWELIDAMDLDTSLREKLFQTAAEPTTCADAGSELFNTMGVQALASQARSYSTSAEELETRLVALGKSAARLQRVNDVARADAMSRDSRAEEVEIYLAYQTNLAQRLGLPWQSDTMLYREVAGVSESAIDKAYDTVLSLEDGDGLVNGMLDQPFWEQFLRETYPDALAANDLLYDRQLDMLEDAFATDSGNPMTEQAYSARVNDLAYKRLDLSRRLTHTLLEKYGL